MAQSKNVKNYCRSCNNNNNNHTILFSERESPDSDDEYFYNETTTYMIVQCAGCSTISYRTFYEDHEAAQEDEHGNFIPYTSVQVYPKIKKHRPFANTWELPDTINVVYRESVGAFESDCPLLAGVGFRAIIEAVCLDKKIGGRNLEIKINNLLKARLITEAESKRLHSIRFLGNDSVHEMKVPTEDALRIVLKIIEHLLSNLYLIDNDTDGVLEKIITDYGEFEQLLNKSLKKFSKGDELPLGKFFEKKYRTIKDNLRAFEIELLNKIKSGGYKKLGQGKFEKFSNSKEKVQHFIVQ